MKIRIAHLIRALALFAAVLPSLHAQDTYTIGSAPCGPDSTPLYCSAGVPLTHEGEVTVAGGFVIHTIDSRPNAQWVKFTGGLSPLGLAYIDSQTITKAVVTSGIHTANEITSVAATFHSADGAYTGTAYIGFGYAYSSGGGGVAGGGAGFKRTATGGFVVVTSGAQSPAAPTSTAMSSGPVGNLVSCMYGGYYITSYTTTLLTTHYYKQCEILGDPTGPKIGIGYWEWYELTFFGFDNIGN